MAALAVPLGQRGDGGRSLRIPAALGAPVGLKVLMTAKGTLRVGQAVY